MFLKKIKSRTLQNWRKFPNWLPKGLKTTNPFYEFDSRCISVLFISEGGEQTRWEMALSVCCHFGVWCILARIPCIICKQGGSCIKWFFVFNVKIWFLAEINLYHRKISNKYTNMLLFQNSNYHSIHTKNENYLGQIRVITENF